MPRLLFLAVLAFAACVWPLQAQPLPFGGSDAPDEFVPGAWWLARTQIGFRGGLSLVGPRWHALGGLDLEYARPGFSAQIRETGRVTTDGFRTDDVDQPYDALRALRYVRWTPRSGEHFYARLGPLRDVRLGTGHIVNFLATDAAWDERTVGAEVGVRVPGVRIDAFSSDVGGRPLAGGYLQLRPFSWTRVPLLSATQLGLTYVRDFLPDPDFDALGVDLSLALVETGGFTVEPFISYARMGTFARTGGRTDGQSLKIGIAGGSPSILDFARVEGRAALLYSGEDFITGFFGPLYTVENTYSAPLDSERFVNSDSTDRSTFGVRLAESGGATGFETEVRLLVFQRFQAWYALYSHYGSQPLTTSRLRLFYGTPDGLTIGLRSDRNGLSGFSALFSSFNDQSTLAIHAEYPIRPGLGAGFEARYTYVRFADQSTERRFLVQRRFDPYFFYRVRL